MPASSPKRPRRSKPRSQWPLAEAPPGLFPTTRDDLLRLLAVLSIAAAAAAACSLLNRRPKPFCGSDSLQGESYAYGHDSCQPCPEHGRCVDGKLECIQGFKKYGKMCIEDGLVSQTVNKILLELRICDQHARALCGQAGKILFKELDISKIADELLSKDFIGLGEDGIKVAKIRVMESARGFFEKMWSNDRVEEFKCPELVAELYRPMTCQFRQWAAQLIDRTQVFSTALDCLEYLSETSINKESRANILAVSPLLSPLPTMTEVVTMKNVETSVCEVLEDKAINAKIGNSECQPWVVTSWLRDHLLVPQERRNAYLWKKVEELIVEDSRIDQYPKVIKGESKVVFEWQASGSLSGKSKKTQGVAGKSRAGAAGAIKLAEELDAR